MTAIELYYSSLPVTNRPYCVEDEEEQVELSELELEAEWEFYLLNQAGIRKSSYEADYRDL
jgi:hypothetical protein